jgi:YYY domain-containing protein
MKRFVIPHIGILIAIVIAGLLLRVIGLNWDDYSRMHPDERFMTTIASRIGHENNLTSEAKARCPDAASQREYFNTDCSIFNPDNVNAGSYVYGTLPLYIVHASAQLAAATNLAGLQNPQNWTTYDYIHLIGRLVNALADTLAILVIYVLGRRLFSARHGLIAAALYALAVLPIQLSHFWTVDTIAHLFFIIALYAAVEISKQGRLAAYGLFGLALGSALASRINLYPMVVLLPLAVLVYILRAESGQRRTRLLEGIFLGAAALAIGALAFRIFQPYAFVGPTINNWSINQNWLNETLHVSDLSRSPSDGWPPSVQWFSRIPFAYAWFNMTVWGMGIALGLAGTAALAAAVILQVRARRISEQVGLLSGWVIVYFLATGGIHQMTMRYYLPLYAPLCLLSAWGLLALPERPRRLLEPLVVGLTVLWGVAFVSIYTQPLTRVEATQWMIDNLPPTIGFQGSDGQQVAARIGREWFNYSMETAVNDESYISDSFEIQSPNQLLGFETEFDDGRATTGKLQLLDKDQKVVFENPFQVSDSRTFQLLTDKLAAVQPGTYYWHIQFHWDDDGDMRGFVPTAVWKEADGPVRRPVNFRSPYATVSYISTSKPVSFKVEQPATALGVIIPHILGDAKQMTFRIGDETAIARQVETLNPNSLLGAGARYQFDKPVTFQPDKPTTLQTDSPVFFTGSAIATDGDWDDSLPIRFCNYRQIRWIVGLSEDCQEVNPGGFGYFINVPLNMAETDTVVKERRMIGALQIADYMAISSNRFYDALPRVPRRFSMSADYYHQLFSDQLGYDVMHIFRRSPSLLGISLPQEVLPTDPLPAWMNEFEAEEAFSVYDHPTVFIFRNAGFKRDTFPTQLPQGDVAPRIRLQVILPTLPDATFSLPTQPVAGSQVVTTLLTWALGFLVVGWLTFPLMYVLFPALPLRGFALSRGVAWLLLALVSWWLTSAGLGVFWTNAGLWLLVFAFAAVCLAVAYWRRAELTAYIRANWRSLLAVEGVFAAAFVFGLLLRAIDPNLWDVTRGGEKPMDFAYLNAVLRTPIFPPPNPWLAGFRINYYYFGFVLAALPIKLGNYAPEVGVNLVLTSLYAVVFSIFAMLAYSLLPEMRRAKRVLLAGCGTAFALLAGNLGTLKLILAPEPDMQPHRWYWYPTRILGESANHAGGAINEMPIFSFLFGDLHAHILGLLPVMLYLVVLWCLIRSRRLWLGIPLGILAGAMLMTNTWDILIYVPIGALAMLFATRSVRRFIILGALVAVSGIITVAPYLVSYAVGEANGVALWTGERSLFEPFLLVWGIPIGVAIVWLLARLHAVFFKEAARPLELGVILVAAVLLLAMPSTLATSVLCLFLVIAGIVLAVRDNASLRPIHVGISFIFAVLLTIEYVVVKGDVGRMNTVFKISFQTWLWAGLLIPLVLYALLQERRYILVALSVVLVGLGLLYPVYALPARYTDNADRRVTLDGNQFLRPLPETQPKPPAYIVNDIDLIHFMRTIPGFPTVAEWYQTEYQWNSRIAVQTGLPSVVGWANHLRQQYTTLHPEIAQRIVDIQRLYTSGDADQIRLVVNKYAIDYIVFGELEQESGSPQTQAVLERMHAAGELELAFQLHETYLYRVNHTAMQSDTTALR